MIFSTRWLQLVPWAFGIRRVTCKTLHHFLNLQTLLENSVLRIPFSLSLVLQLEKWKEQTITQILSVDLLYWLTDYHLITNSVFENGWIYSTTVHKLTTTIWGFMSRPCWRMFSSISHSIARTWSRIYTTCNHQLQVKKKSYYHLHLTGSHLWFVSGSWLYRGGSLSSSSALQVQCRDSSWWFAIDSFGKGVLPGHQCQACLEHLPVQSNHVVTLSQHWT